MTAKEAPASEALAGDSLRPGDDLLVLKYPLPLHTRLLVWKHEDFLGDRRILLSERHPEGWDRNPDFLGGPVDESDSCSIPDTVSYTHLTLPTIYSV